MADYIVIFLAGLTIGQWLALWGVKTLLAAIIQSVQE
jgi:hypothetical protein